MLGDKHDLQELLAFELGRINVRPEEIEEIVGVCREIIKGSKNIKEALIRITYNLRKYDPKVIGIVAKTVERKYKEEKLRELQTYEHKEDEIAKDYYKELFRPRKPKRE